MPNNFSGRHGASRLNCAQAVAAAFNDLGLLTEAEYDGLTECGYGQAPQGYCGSVYAALTLLAKASPDKVEQLKNDFCAYALLLNCREIRAQRKISCAQSVKKEAELVELLLEKNG